MKNCVERCANAEVPGTPRADFFDPKSFLALHCAIQDLISQWISYTLRYFRFDEFYQICLVLESLSSVPEYHIICYSLYFP